MTPDQESAMYKAPSVKALSVDPTTGGQKGIKAERYDLVPPEPLRLLALHYGLNCVEHGGKYPPRNWELGYKWSLSFAAMMRHAWAFWRGEWFDPESPGGKIPHLVAVAWHAFALLEWARTRPEKDDRPDPTTLNTLTPVESMEGLRPRCACHMCAYRPERERCFSPCGACERCTGMLGN